MEDRVTHDENAYRYMMDHFPGSERQHGTDRFLTTCPSCGAKKKFWWFDKMPHNGGCFACDHKLKSVFDLGYRTDRKTREFSDLSSIDSLVLFYHNKTNKRHRLSKRVIDEFSLQSLPFQKKNSVGFYHNISIPDNATLGCVKHLNFGGKDQKPTWISVPGKFRNDRVWLNAERIKPADEYIFVLAGEWDMFAFWEHVGIHGISPVDGEGTAGKLPKEAYDIFSNKKVIILFDNDKAGRAGSKGLAKAIQRRVKTKSIKVVDLERLGLVGGEDIDDFFANGGTKDRLKEEVEATPEYEDALSQDEVELERIPEPFGRPHNPNSTLEPSTLGKIWKTLLLPEAKRQAILSDIAESEGYSKELAPGLFKNQIRTYEQELNTLRYAAFDQLINDWFDTFHVRQSIRHSDMSEALYYYYAEGYYQYISDDFLTSHADAIARKVTAPDNRTDLSKARKQVLEDIETRLLSAPETNFDNHKKYINFENGTYVLKSRELVPHSPKFLLNYKLPITFDGTQDCPNLKKALRDWTHKEEDAKELLKGLFYLISGDRSKDVIFWLQGDGNDGKSQFTHLCRSLIGEKRTSALAIETIEKTHYTAELFNKYLNIADEVPASYVIPDAMFKRISGNSVLTGDPKYKGLFTFVSRALWVIPSNHFPNISDTSRGYFRRFKIFLFKQITKEKEVSEFFETRLKPELSGIVNYILTEGRNLFEKDGFVKTETELGAMTEMKEKNSAFLYWQNTFTLWEDKIKEAMEKYQDTREQVIMRTIAKPSDFMDTEKLDVIQVYEKQNKEKVIVVNPRKHYEYYREFFEKDEVKPMSLSKFRKSTQNFYKEYFPEKTVEKIRVWKRDLDGTKSDYFLSIT